MRRRSGMALVLVLAIMLLGSVFIAVALTVVMNMRNITEKAIDGAVLYNAAQSGAAWGVSMVGRYRDDLDLETRQGLSGVTFDPSVPSHLDAIRAVTKDGEILDGIGAPAPHEGVTVTVDILHCDYKPPLNHHPLLPPVMPFRMSGGGGSSGHASTPEGTSVIIDPSRLLVFGGGGPGESFFVIRSTASFHGRSRRVETMIAIEMGGSGQ